MTVFPNTHAQLWPKEDDHCPLSDHKGNVTGKSIVPAVHGAYPRRGINYHYSLLYRFGHPHSFTLFNPFARHFLCSLRLVLKVGVLCLQVSESRSYSVQWAPAIPLACHQHTTDSPMKQQPNHYILRAGRNRIINSIIKNIINLAGKTNTNSCGQGQSTSEQTDLDSTKL